MRLLVILSYFLGLVPIRFPNFCDSLLFSPAEVHDFNSSKPTLTFLDSSSFLFRDGPAFLEDGILDVLLFLWLSYWAVASSCSRSFSFPCSSEISCGYAFFFSPISAFSLRRDARNAVIFLLHVSASTPISPATSSHASYLLNL